MGCDRIAACEELLQGGPHQRAGALRMLRSLAAEGEPRAMHALGVALQEGVGVAPDPTEAARWYRRAAERDHAPAARNLGILHQVGLGVPEDLAEAARLYRQAGEAGDALAAFNLAALLEAAPRARAAVPDADPAAWYRVAARAGHRGAADRLKWLTAPPGAPVEFAVSGPGADFARTGTLWDRLVGRDGGRA